jgi:tRNA-modifying protein YgfZ
LQVIPLALPRPWLDAPAAVHLTGDRLLRIEGSGSRRWLNAMLTADLRTAAPGVARYALLLCATGGIVSDAWVVEHAVGEPERLTLVLPEACAERAARELTRFVVNEEIALTFDDDVRVVSLQGPRGRDLLDIDGPVAVANAYPCARLGPQGLDVWVRAPQVDLAMALLSASASRLGGGAMNAIEWCSARVALGVPQAGTDFNETTSPHEAGIEARAISFTKGCYLGQQTVARQHRRGGLTQRLVQLDVEGPQGVEKGSGVRGPSGEEVGRVTSVASASDEGSSALALAYLTAPFAQVGARVMVGERQAQVRSIVGRLGTAAPPHHATAGW